jgi:hypothetical protein
MKTKNETNNDTLKIVECGRVWVKLLYQEAVLVEVVVVEVAPTTQ